MKESNFSLKKKPLKIGSLSLFLLLTLLLITIAPQSSAQITTSSYTISIDSINKRIEVDDVATKNITISNLGGAPLELTFELTEGISDVVDIDRHGCVYVADH